MWAHDAGGRCLSNSRVQVVHVAEEPIGGALQIAVGGGKCTARMLLRETSGDGIRVGTRVGIRVGIRVGTRGSGM